MNSNKLVSIIVPIYNVEKYLEKCVCSILNQDYNNLEVILVNDGSTDKSLEICERLQKKDNRIKIINQKNLGVSAARNNGFYYSKGDYICFIDSDDIIEIDMVSTLVKLLQENEYEVANCNIHIIEKDKTERNFYTNKNIKIYNSSELKKYFLLGKVSHACWDKMYKREVLEKVNFVLNSTSEDRYFCWKLYKTINKMVVTSKVGYHYIRKNENSITSRPLSLKNISRIEEALNVKNDVLLHYPELYDEWEYYYLNGLDNLASKFIEQKIKKDDKLYKYYEFIILELEKILKHSNPYIDVKRKNSLLEKYKKLW